MQPAERDARYGPDDGAFTAAVEDWRAGGDHARADGPGGTGGRSVEPPACGASVALDVSVYRSAACSVGAMRDDGAQGAFIGGAGWPDAVRAIATRERTHAE